MVVALAESTGSADAGRIVQTAGVPVQPGSAAGIWNPIRSPAPSAFACKIAQRSETAPLQGAARSAVVVT